MAHRIFSIRILPAASGLIVATIASVNLGAAQQNLATTGQSDLADAFSAMSIWDDGLSEMSYFDATDDVYGKQRKYTRVVLVNRQWMDPATGTKADPKAGDSVPVFKLNISEEIPTENYNYRYLNTLFLRRGDLRPFKMVVSSQEWCGTTFKHVRWNDEQASFQTFSYFPGEGDRRATATADVVPYEGLLLVARSVVADGHTRFLNLLHPMRSNHLVQPRGGPARLTVHDAGSVTVPAGTFPAVRVKVKWAGPETSFVVESKPPHRLLKYQQGKASGELAFVERRPYWNRSSKSGFHKPNQAP